MRRPGWLFLIFLVALGVGGLAWRLRPAAESPGVPPSPTAAEVGEDSPDDGEEETEALLEPTVVTPGPLVQRAGVRPVTLSSSGVIQWSNIQRANAGQTALADSPRLREAAERKLRDMFARQYFAHDDPDGRGISAHLAAVGYAYLRAGENLARGSFASDAALVAAWMDSPGHRANVLGPAYREIGVAVGEGTFESHRTWLAVQVFGLPRSACPAAPSPSQRSAMEQEQENLAVRSAEIASAQSEIARETEALAGLAGEVERLVAEGNAKVAEGNQEIEEGNRLAAGGDRAGAQEHWRRGEELQREGQARHDEAEVKRAEHERRRSALLARVTAVNAEVTEFNAERERLAQQLTALNARIRAFNSCAA